MRLMQHMFPQLLTEVPAAVSPFPVAQPAGALGAKALDPTVLAGLVTGVTSGLGAIVGGVGNIVASGNSSRAQQEAARQATLQADIAARNAAAARAQQLTIIKYVVPAVLVALTIYLLLR